MQPVKYFIKLLTVHHLKERNSNKREYFKKYSLLLISYNTGILKISSKYAAGIIKFQYVL